MDLPASELTPEQKKKLAEFEAAIAAARDEEEKARRALEGERRTIESEVM